MIHTVVLGARDADGNRYKTAHAVRRENRRHPFSSSGFLVQVREREAIVHQLKKPAGGPVVDTVGTICIDDLDFVMP